MQIINVAICTWATLFTWLALTLPNETKQFYFMNNVNNVTVPTSPPPTKKKKATFTLSLGFNCDVYLKKFQIIDHKRYTYTCISLYKNFSLYFKLSVKLYPQKIHSPSLASYFNHQDYRHDFDFFFFAIQPFLCESVGGTCMGHLQVVTYYLSK